MDLTKLETFLAVARTGSFRLAAESLYLTPPTVSKHIAWLESAYRVSLFRRSPTGVTLTEEGRLLIPYAERILEEQRAFLSALSAVNRERIIRICAIPPLSMVADFSIFSAFKRRCPEFQLSLSEEHGGAVSHLLAEGRYHLGLCASSYLDSTLVECLPLDRHELIVPVPLPCRSWPQILLYHCRRRPAYLELTVRCAKMQALSTRSPSPLSARKIWCSPSPKAWG